MPGPGIYVVAVVVGVAAGIAFKEFVYDPHLAPKIEQWTGAYATYLSARRQKRALSHSYSHLHPHSDDEGEDHGKSSVELEGLVEREMHTLGRETTLRQRKTAAPETSGLEMMEKSNPFIPFAPLSPSPMSPTSNAPSTRNDESMPIGRLPTPQAAQTLRSPDSASSARPFRGVDPSHAPPQNPQNFLNISSAPQGALGLHVTTPATSEYDFAEEISRGTSPFTGASISRTGTPWTDPQSDAWSTDLQSNGSLSDNFSEASSEADIEHPHHGLDASLYHSAVFSQASLDNHSEIALDNQSNASSVTSLSSSVGTQSDTSLDFLGSEGDQHIEPVDMRSPISGLAILSDDEWDHMSEMGRSAHQ